MRKLTENQKNFILEYFFENEKYAGWKGIATKLLERGNCIVSVTGCIWHGGIGNFIKTEPAKGAIDCSLYTFDLDVFIDSKYFKEVYDGYVSKLEEKKRKRDSEYNDILNLNVEETNVKSINHFIKKLQAISEDKRKLPLVITCPNGLQVYPEIRMQFDGMGNPFVDKLEKMVIHWD